MPPKLSPGYSIMLRLEYPDVPGFLGRITTVIGEAGGTIDSVDSVNVDDGRRTRDLCVHCASEEHGRNIVTAVKRIRQLRIVEVMDRTILLHRGGKIRIENKVQLNSRDALSMAYTPGVARISTIINKDPERAYELTIKGRAIAIVSDGTAVLGLGNVGPKAALPVMEGKAMLFKRFADLEAFPICIDTQDVEEIIKVVKALAPTFGGVNLEDISAPRCFEIEERLIKEMDIPVFHDDQHGTAVVVLAALTNALRIIKKRMENIQVVISGAGAAGVATLRLLREAGCRNIICCDTVGAIYSGRKEHMNSVKEWVAENTNPKAVKGTLKQAIRGADVFIGVSAPDILSRADIRKMNKDAIVFALSNPDPEIRPEEIGTAARIVATGRSDYPNQINNVLCFPGLFKGTLAARAHDITTNMKLAAARAIAEAVPENELSEENIIPSVFNPNVAPAVAEAVARAAGAGK